jgi:collagenase-like PrtC family protease
VQLTCPTNWDDALLEKLHGLPVNDLYGQVDWSPAGGGRPRYIQGHTDARQAAAHIRAIRDLGWGFTTLLNAPCLDNRELDGAFRRSLLDHVAWARDAGADAVTVTIPLLAEAIKARFPDLWVKVSVIAHVGTVTRARAWASLGVDEIAVDFNVNRDLRRLEALRRAVDVELSLLVNDLCLLDCPFRHYHYNLVGHASQQGHDSDGFVVDYCFLRCHHRKVLEPIELLKSPWVRPEDLAAYEAIGIRRFKLAGRTKSSRQIAAMARSYAQRRYDGNLLDILEGTSRDTSTLGFAALRTAVQRSPGLLGRGLAALGKLPVGASLPGPTHFGAVLRRLDPKAREELLAAYVQLMQLSDAVQIDNRQLDGFLAGFSERRCGEECDRCAHCRAYAERAVTVDSERCQAIASAVRKVLDGVIDGHALP